MSMKNFKLTKNKQKVIADKLPIGFSLVISLFIVIGSVSNLEMRTLSNLTRTLYNHPLVVSNAALTANVEIIKIHRSMKDVVLLGHRSTIDTAIIAVNESEGNVYRQLDIVSKNILGKKGQKLEAETRKLFSDWKEIREEVISLVQTGQREKAAIITMGKGADHVALLETKALELTSYARRKADGFMENAENVISRIHRTSIILIVSGALFSAVIAFYTIRKKRITKEKVRENLNLVQSVIEGVDDPIYVQDTETCFLLANTATAKLLGQDLLEILGKSNDELFSQERAAINNKKNLSVINTGKSSSFEEDIQTEEGTQTYLSLKTPLREESGEIIGVINISRNISDRKKAEDQVADSLREKEVLLREVHHRVKNNLQIISSLLNLQSLSSKSEEESIMLRESKSRIDVMASVHEKLYQTGDLANISFTTYIESFIYDLFNLYGVDTNRVQLILSDNNITLDIEHAIPCGLIINELISNSFKYAFPDKKEGSVTVTLQEIEKDMFELCVGDNGIGIPDNFDIANSQSLGLRLVYILTHNQLEGEAELDRANGTLFRIQFFNKRKE